MSDKTIKIKSNKVRPVAFGYRRDPITSASPEKSCFYDKSQNDLFKKRFSFDLHKLTKNI